MKKYKEFISKENVDDLRERLIKIMHKEALSMSALAREMEMTPIVLCGFVREEKNVSFVTLVKIEDYVTAKEKE